MITAQQETYRPLAPHLQLRLRRFMRRNPTMVCGMALLGYGGPAGVEPH